MSSKMAYPTVISRIASFRSLFDDMLRGRKALGRVSVC